MRMKWSIGLIAVVYGCAADAPDAGRNRLPLAPVKSTTATPTSDSGLSQVMNAQGGLLPTPTASGASGAAGSSSSDSAGSGDLPAGCEVGKFCAPMTPDPMDCGSLTLKQDVEVKPVPGNLLLIFDQSLSMAEPWGMSGQSKLQAAQAAIANAVTTLQDSLTVGALFFPTYDCVPALPPPMGGAVSPIDGPGQIPFQAAPQFLQAWSQHWSNPLLGLGIGTPMQEAFDRADAAIQSAQLKGAVIVVAVTDGEPNCFPDASITMTPTALETERAAAWLAKRDVKSHVVGLPGAAGVQLLNDVAMNGGTMQYLLPDDPKMLEAKLKEVVRETVTARFDSCSIKLTPAADPPEKLQMLVVEAKDGKKSRVEHMLSADAGWTISADGKQVEITGQLCDDAKSGRFSAITFEYGCKNVPPPPPLPPPMLN